MRFFHIWQLVTLDWRHYDLSKRRETPASDTASHPGRFQYLERAICKPQILRLLEYCTSMLLALCPAQLISCHWIYREGHKQPPPLLPPENICHMGCGAVVYYRVHKSRAIALYTVGPVGSVDELARGFFFEKLWASGIIEMCRRFRRYAEGWGRRILWRICTYPPDYTVSHLSDVSIQ